MVSLLVVVLAVVLGALLVSWTGRTPATTPTATVTSVGTVTVTSTSTVTVTSTKTVTQVATVTKTVEKVEKELSVVDALGRVVRIKSTPKRVVTLAPSITEIVFALGCGDRVVGVDSFSNYPPELTKLVKEGRIAVVGGYWKPDIEKIVALHPDVVFADAGVPSHMTLARRLEAMGVKVIFLHGGGSSSVYDVYRDIMIVAKVLGVEEEGKRLVEEIEKELEAVSKLVAGEPKPKVLVLFGTPKWGVYAAGGGTFIDYVVRQAGGINVASRLHGWVQLSYEQVLEMNPTVVIVSAMASTRGDAAKVLQAWASTPLNKTLAFTRGTVCIFYGMADDVLSRPGPRIGIAVQLVASVLHPEAVSIPKNYSGYVYCVHFRG